ncbi:MAG TPA: ABC transporter substrate-binding protein [Syntrophobacteria bacterium]|nr:ABC transporter substrate-binding protein [Syntrophobacteria bacterium]
MKKFLCGFGVALFFALPFPANGATPLATIEANVNRVLDVLRDPALKAESAKEAKKQKIRAISEEMFDEKELAKRTLARNWEKLTADQRQEFILLYRKVLEKVYMDKILSYTNEKIVFDKANVLGSDKAEVETRIITSSKEIPIMYRVILRDGAWKVYDVVIEGVSLVQNYRSQFNELLVKNSPEQVLDILRKKVQET